MLCALKKLESLIVFQRSRGLEVAGQYTAGERGGMFFEIFFREVPAEHSRSEKIETASIWKSAHPPALFVPSVLLPLESTFRGTLATTKSK